MTIFCFQILEKSLTGYDASKDVKPKETRGRGKKSRIAPDPHPAVEVYVIFCLYALECVKIPSKICQALQVKIHHLYFTSL